MGNKVNILLQISAERMFRRQTDRWENQGFSVESQGEKSKLRGKKEEAGGGGELRLGDHKGNYLHQPAKSPIKLESTTQ